MVSLFAPMKTETMNTAIKHHLAGRLVEAESIYKKVLLDEPDNYVALHLLGVIAHQVRKHDIAVDLITKALTIKPEYADAHYNLGNAYKEMGQLVAALESYQKAITINSDYTKAFNNLGLVFQDLGRLDEAKASFHKVLASEPDNADAHYNLGNTLKDLGQLNDALECYQTTLALDPDYAKAFNNLWIVLRSMCHDLLPRSYGKLPFEQIIDGLPTLLEPSIIRFQLNSLMGGNVQEAWKFITCNLPTIENETIHNPVDETESSINKPKVTTDKRVTALLHFGRSGSGYLQSLLDGHPEISTMPGVYMSGFFGRKVWENISGEGIKKIPARFSQLYKVLFDARCPDGVPRANISDTYTDHSVGFAEGFVEMGENRDTPLSLNHNRFNENLSVILNGTQTINHGQLFEAIHHAYDKTLGINKQEKGAIFYHLHKNDPYTMANFLRYFPAAQLLMIIRNPVISCESWAIKSVQGDHENSYLIYCDIIDKIAPLLMDLNCPLFHSHNAIAVRLEDIKKKNAETMHRLCAYLRIKNAPTLYQSTMQGLKWWGDPSSTLYGRTHDTESWEDDPTRAEPGTFFSTSDQFILATLFYPLSARFGYVETNAKQFAKDLKTVYPLISKPLDFEKKLASTFLPGYPVLENTTSFKSFHAILVALWQVLDERGTYPYMLKSLPHA